MQRVNFIMCVQRLRSFFVAIYVAIMSIVYPKSLMRFNTEPQENATKPVLPVTIRPQADEIKPPPESELTKRY